MIFSRNVGVQILPVGGVDPTFFHELLARWMADDLAKVPCQRTLERMLREDGWAMPPDCFDPAAIKSGGFAATKTILYPQFPWTLGFMKKSGTESSVVWQRSLGFDRTEGQAVAAALRTLLKTDEREDFRHAAALFDAELATALSGGNGNTKARWPEVATPGIYRREHGSVVIRSETTSIMLDPLPFWLRYSDAPLNLDGAPLDAICITHGHRDHINLPSILYYAPSPQTPVIVPKVPRPNVLSVMDMHAALTMLGQQALAPDWGTTLRIGDIDVDVLPFYGEQPTREGDGPPPDIRNWGNCYRFRTPTFSVLALIDSGKDPAGDMVDVVRRSADAHGPVDVVMSSLPRFYSPFFLGLPECFLALPFERLKQLFAQYRAGTLPSVTPGPRGVVAICEASSARHYLPYGNGFEGVGVPIQDVGIEMGEPSEADAIALLQRGLEARGVATQAHTWCPGDVVAVTERRLLQRAVAHGTRS